MASKLGRAQADQAAFPILPTCPLQRVAGYSPKWLGSWTVSLSCFTKSVSPPDPAWSSVNWSFPPDIWGK